MLLRQCQHVIKISYSNRKNSFVVTNRICYITKKQKCIYQLCVQTAQSTSVLNLHQQRTRMQQKMTELALPDKQ